MAQFESTPGARGSGQDEDQVHVHSGLRVASAHYTVPCGVLTTAATWTVLNPTSFGGTAGASVLTWTSLRGSSWLGYMPCPATPQVFVILAATGANKIRLRVTGYDQFQNHIVETTPWLSKTQSDTAYACLVTLSKVFSYVENVEYMSIGVNSNGSLIGVGLTGIMSTGQIDAITEDYGDPLGGGAASLLDDLNTIGNYGFGTPLRVLAYTTPDIFDPPGSATLPLDPAPRKDPEILHASQVTLRNNDGNTVTQENVVTVFRSFQAQGYSATAYGTRLGYSVSGWQGTPHKIGIVAGDDLVAGITDTVTNGSTVAATDGGGGAGNRVGDMNADDKEFFFVIRSARGTEARSTRGRYYPR